MNLAKTSANGQITIPVEIRRLLGLKPGDKNLFIQNQNGEIIVSNAHTGDSQSTDRFCWCS